MGHVVRSSSWMTYGSAAHSSSRWLQSDVQSSTLSVTIFERLPRSRPSPTCSSKLLANRSSTVTSGLLDHDGLLGAVGLGQPGGMLLIGRDHAAADDRSVAFVIFGEQRWREVVAAPMALALGVVDADV